VVMNLTPYPATRIKSNSSSKRGIGTRAVGCHRGAPSLSV
jgi:hypothetical protein